MKGRWFSIAGMCLLILPVASVANAQAFNYPTKPVMIISDAAAGTAPDVTARFVAEGLGKIWGQQVVVINHPGANGSIAAHAASDYRAKSPTEAAARVPADRIHGRAADVHRRGRFARRHGDEHRLLGRES